MQKLSKKKFEQKCEELGVGANQSIFFKKGFFYKFGCNPFCSVEHISIPANSIEELEQKFLQKTQENEAVLQMSSSAIIHFNINKNFTFQVVQRMMETLHKYLKEDIDVVMSVMYHDKDTTSRESVSLFLKE